MKKQSRNRIWVAFIAIALFVLSACGSAADKNSASQADLPEGVIAISGEKPGEYGRLVTLNAGSDMPAEMYFYKIPAGNYKVTTDFNKEASVNIVKDEVNNTGSGMYPEELVYVGESYKFTAGEEVQITIGEDESILLGGSETVFFEKVE